MVVILKTPEKIIIRTNANESLANAIRRSIDEVQVLAIDEVEIFKNDSALYDELLAHRLGLVPLKTEKGMSEKTKIEFKLSKLGPCTVYSGDLDGNEEVVYSKIPLTILGEGRKLELVATATLGKGIQHAKYVPGICYYRHLSVVKSSSETDAIIQNSTGLIKPEKKGNSWICDLSDADAQKIEEIDQKLLSDADEILLVIESYGNMDAKDIFAKSVDALEDNLDEFVKAIK